LIYPRSYRFRQGIALSLKGLTRDLSTFFDRLPLVVSRHWRLARCDLLYCVGKLENLTLANMTGAGADLPSGPVAKLVDFSRRQFDSGTFRV
jgi:hypothetical protein